VAGRPAKVVIPGPPARVEPKSFQTEPYAARAGCPRSAVPPLISRADVLKHITENWCLHGPAGKLERLVEYITALHSVTPPADRPCPQHFGTWRCSLREIARSRTTAQLLARDMI